MKRYIKALQSTLVITFTLIAVFFVFFYILFTSILPSSVAIIIGFFMGFVVLLYFILRLNTTQEMMLETLEQQQVSAERLFFLGKEITEDPRLAQIIEGIVDDYKVVKKKPFPIFENSMFDTLRKCQNSLDNLAEGELTSDALGQSSYLFTAIGQARKSVKFVRSSVPPYLSGEGGKTYRESVMGAQRQGIRVTAIWLLSKEDLIKHSSLIKLETTADVQIFAAERESVPREIYNDYAIIDGEMLITTLLTGRSGLTVENISLNEDKVKRAERNFDSLLNYSVSVREYYARSDTKSAAGDESIKLNNS